MADYDINAVTRRVVFTGSAGLGPYSFTFEILDDDDLAVYFNTTKLTKTTDYTVTINANGTGSVSVIVNVGGNIPATPDADDTIIIVGARDIERVTDFVTAGDLLASSLNEQLDSLTIFDQQVAEEQKRSLQAPVYDPAHVDDGGSLDMTLPAKDTRKGKTLQFNATTGNPEAGPTIDAVANAQTNATNAAASATAAAASATAAAASATSASTAQTAAETAETNAETAETNAETAQTAAETAKTGAETAQTAAETAETNASTSATTATTKASEAATSATNAATSATTATTKASEASTSATNAATSATAAAASQTAAAASAASAASAFDNFDDTYLGSKTADPTVDNDGDPLTQGDLYFNSTANEMRVYDGANWIAATSAGGVSLILYEYTATAGQTTFSGSDDNSATLSYTADNLQVVMNGIVLDPSDFTATNGTSVVLASGAAANDLVNIYAFKSFTTADMVSKTAGGTFAGAVAFSDGVTIDDDGATPLTVDRATSNGNVAEFQKDGTTVGAIGIANGDNLYISSDDTNDVGIKFNGDGNRITPCDASGADRTNLIDLGEGSARFKDLHLGGTAYLSASINEATLPSTPANHAITLSPPTTSNSYGGGISWSEGTNTAASISTVDDGSGGALGLVFSTGTNSGIFERMRIQKDGQVNIASTGTPSGASSATRLTVRQVSGTDALFLDRTSDIDSNYRDLVRFARNGTTVGQIKARNNAVQYNTTSDARLKENVEDMTGAIDRVKTLRPKRYSWIVDNLDAPNIDGFLAHEAQTVVPDAVSGTQNEVDDDGNPVYQGIDHGLLVPLLTGALKEAIAKIETLETKVAALEAAS